MTIFMTHAKVAYSTHVELIDDVIYPQKVHWFPDSYSRVKTGLFYPPHVVINKVVDKIVIDAIKGNPVKTAFIFASGTSTLNSNKAYKNTRLSYEYKVLPLTLTNIYAGRMANMFGRVDMVQTDSTACASSIKVLMDVQTLIRHYGFERAIVMTGEDQVSNSTLEFFGESKACILDDSLPTAFDNHGGGFHVGQGAALAVFETERGLSGDPIAKLLGAYAAAEENTNAIGQREDGAGFSSAIRGALRYSGLSATDISVIKTHGTGTPSNNVSEANGIRSVVPEFVATSYKPSIGHTMGASGLLESILLIRDLRKGFVPAIANRTEKDDVFLSEDADAPKSGVMLSNAAGMGNVYASALFDWWA